MICFTREAKTLCVSFHQTQEAWNYVHRESLILFPDISVHAETDANLSCIAFKGLLICQFGETLSYDSLDFVRMNCVNWGISTLYLSIEIAFSTFRETVDSFPNGARGKESA